MAPNGRLSLRRLSQRNHNHNGTSSDGDDNNDHHTQTHHRNNNNKNLPLPIQAYIPPYLHNLVRPYHGDFCYAHSFHPRLITQLMAEGFLPIASDGLLLPKLHLLRSVIPLKNTTSSSSSLHISKSTRKKSKRFAISANCAFLEVVRACQEQHGSHSWLYPPLVEAFVAMHQASLRDENVALVQSSSSSSLSSSCSSSSVQVQHQCQCQVRLYSIEVWDLETGALAGGELGYTVGTIYTSLTGFSRQDSAGSVQLAALGKWLEARGFELWDLGMDMDYKRSLGSVLCPRHEFVSKVHSVRAQPHNNHVRLPSHQRYNAKNMIDGDLVSALEEPPRSSSPPTSSPPMEETLPCRKKARS